MSGAGEALLQLHRVGHESRLDGYAGSGGCSLDELPDLDREVMLEHFPNEVGSIIRENTFVELWPSYLGFLATEELNGLFQSILMHREELSLTGVFIEFPGTWMFERGRLLRDRKA